MTTQIDSNREFQFWQFQVSHGRALVRSPMGGTHSMNVDLMFFGVDYIALPRVLGTIQLLEHTKEEQELCSSILGRQIAAEQLFVVEAKHRHLVVAARLIVNENQLELFESPFESIND